MTSTDPQADRERMAMQWLMSRGLLDIPTISPAIDIANTKSLATLLASTEARMLEEAARLADMEYPFAATDAERLTSSRLGNLAAKFRQQAKERK